MHISDQNTQPLSALLAIFYANERPEQRYPRIFATAKRRGAHYVSVFNEDERLRRQMLGLPPRPCDQSTPPRRK